MALYLILLLFLVIVSVNYHYSISFSRPIFIGCILFITFLAAFRGDTVGNDTYKYLLLFDYIRDYPIHLFTDRYEIGYVLLNKVIATFSSNSQWLLIITSIFIWSSICYTYINYSSNPTLSLFFLITIGLYAFFLSGIRESIAISICLFAFTFVINKKPILFIVIVLIASLFHTSSLVFIPAYLLYHHRFTIKSKILLVIGTITTIVLFDRLLNIVVSWFPKYGTYLNSDYNNGSIRIASVLNAVLLLVIYLICHYYIKVDGNATLLDNRVNNEGINNLLLIGVALLIASFSFNLLDRLANYYTIFLTIIIPNVLAKTISKSKLICLIGLIYVFIVYFMVVQFLRPEWNSIYPYSFFWN